MLCFPFSFILWFLMLSLTLFCFLFCFQSSVANMVVEYLGFAGASAIRVFRTFRCLRPLRAMSRLESLKVATRLLRDGAALKHASSGGMAQHYSMLFLAGIPMPTLLKTQFGNFFPDVASIQDASFWQDAYTWLVGYTVSTSPLQFSSSMVAGRYLKWH